MVENQIIQLPNPKGDFPIFAHLKLSNWMLLGYAVSITLFVGLVAPVFSNGSKKRESYRQTKISPTNREGVNRMAFYLAQILGDRRGYILNRDEYYLKED
jgi:CHASE3 domain sensor protein